MVCYGCMVWACVIVTGTITTTKMMPTNEIMFMTIETPLSSLFLLLSSVPWACNNIIITITKTITSHFSSPINYFVRVNAVYVLCVCTRLLTCVWVCRCSRIAKWLGHWPGNWKVAGLIPSVVILMLLFFPWARNSTHIPPVCLAF